MLKHARHECAWTAERDVRAELAQGPNVGTRDAAEQNVAEDSDVEAGDVAFLFADGKHIEQRLRGVLVRAVAGVDHMGVEKAREKMRCASGFVADDDDVGIERLEGARGVLEALAFLE